MSSSKTTDGRKYYSPEIVEHLSLVGVERLLAENERLRRVLSTIGADFASMARDAGNDPRPGAKSMCVSFDCDEEAVGQAEIEDHGWFDYCQGCIDALFRGGHQVRKCAPPEAAS